MVITTDYNIFADKYHNRQHLPNDIINMIMNINTQEIKAKKNYKNVCDTIKQIKYYNDDGLLSIYELTSNNLARRQHRYRDIKYIFKEPLYPRIFQVLKQLNLENNAYVEINKHKKHKIKQSSLNRSIAFYEFLTDDNCTIFECLENNVEYINDFIKLYPENLIRDFYGFTMDYQDRQNEDMVGTPSIYCPTLETIKTLLNN